MYAGRLLTIGLLAGSVVRTGPVLTPAAAPAPDQLHEVVRPRTVQGDIPPVPLGRISRPQGLAPVATISHHLVEPRVVDPSAQPLPVGQIIRTEKTPKAVATFNQLALAPRVVRGDSAGFPDDRVLRSQIAEVVTFHQGALAVRVVRGDAVPLPDDRIVRTHKRPAAVADFNQPVLAVRVVRGDAAPLPLADVQQTKLFHSGRDDPALPLRVVRGDAAPTPEGFVLRTGHQEQLHPAAPTFNQHVAPRRVDGDAAPEPESRVLHVRKTPAAEVAFNQAVLAPRVVSGDPAPAPEGVVHKVLGFPPPPTTHLTWFFVVRGDPPPSPLGRTLRWGQYHTGLIPIVGSARGFFGRNTFTFFLK